MSDYRDKFFEHHKPLPNGKYRCAYCNKMFLPAEITVDHLIPQNTFKKTKQVLNGVAIGFLILGLKVDAMFLLGIAGCLLTKKLADKQMNSIANLVPACQPCNSSKNDNIDGRIVVGALSKFRPENIVGYILAFVFTTIGLIFKILWWTIKSFLLVLKNILFRRRHHHRGRHLFRLSRKRW